MHILVVSQYFWPEQFKINDLVSALRSRGHQITVLTGKPNYPSGDVFKEYVENPTAYLSYCGAEIIRVPMMARGNNPLRLILNYLSFALSACFFGLWHFRRTKFDSVFVFGTSPITACLPAILFGKIKKVKVVLWVLDLWPDTLLALGVVKSKWILNLVNLLVSFIYVRCDLILGQSKEFVSRIKQFPIESEKVRFFPNWAEDIFENPASEKAPEVEERIDRFNIVFAGNLGEAQDLPNILEAASILKKLKLVRWIFVGDGRKFNWLRDEINKRQLVADCLLVGSFPLDRMPSFYAHADALLVSLANGPAFSLTVPGKVQSYLKSGKPLLGMINGEGRELIKEAGAGLVCPAGNPIELAKNIVTMARLNEEDRTKMGVNGIRYAKNEFDRLTLIERLESWLANSLQS